MTQLYVSILDLLEVGFRRPWGFFQCWGAWVSILDLLEVGFRPLSPRLWYSRWREFQSLICWKSDSDTPLRLTFLVWLFSFNPWFVGSRIQTCGRVFLRRVDVGFNPWFVGSRIQTFRTWSRRIGIRLVSILDLLEVGFRQRATRERSKMEFLVSILDLLEVGFRRVSSPSWRCNSSRFQSLICWKSDSDNR